MRAGEGVGSTPGVEFQLAPVADFTRVCRSKPTGPSWIAHGRFFPSAIIARSGGKRGQIRQLANPILGIRSALRHNLCIILRNSEGKQLLVQIERSQ